MQSRRKAHPDEKGTESAHHDAESQGHLFVAKHIPMRRELKDFQLCRLVLGRMRRKAHPDEKGTESRQPPLDVINLGRSQSTSR